MDNLTILNYMGSKKNLIEFIHSKISTFITENDTLLDIFAGTCTVGYSYKRSNIVYANDSEKYAAIISAALLGNPISKIIITRFLSIFNEQYQLIYNNHKADIDHERHYINKNDIDNLIKLYSSYKTIWNDKNYNLNSTLFISYYASNYFSIQQAAEIDAIRLSIDSITDKNDINILFACLFYAMKECVFAKDGHMAQPLEIEKNKQRLLSQRKKSIISFFKTKLDDFLPPNFAPHKGAINRNKTYNLDFEELLENEEIKKEVSVIYADPPYTDMQYSRYYHLLNTVIDNHFSTPTKLNNVYTKGLYLNNRYQSKLSQKNSCLNQMEKLISFSSKYNKTLIISFGYPQNTEEQKTDRYVLDITSLISKCKEYYGDNCVKVEMVPYEHSNNRNSTTKHVIEYLIICKKDRLSPTKIERIKEQLKSIIPSKNNPIYNSHIYWSQKPYNICDLLIETFSNKGDTIFDPFLGSGVTLLEAVKDKYSRYAIGCEINEAPITIVKTLLKNYSLDSYKKDSSVLISELKNLNHYYLTQCPNCGTQSIINSVLFDLPERKTAAQLKKISLICPKCKKVDKIPDAIDIEKFNYSYVINNIINERLHENTRLAVYKDEHISDIFTSRNFKVIDEVLELIENHNEFKDVYKYILMSVLHLCKITDTHSNSQWPLWIPKKDCIEKNVILLLCNRIDKFKSTIEYIEENYSSSKHYLLLQKGSQHITEDDIPDNSVNLIITDPPYLGQVAYSEYMQLYKPFLGLDFNLEDEIIVMNSAERQKTEPEYFKSLDSVFAICDKKMIAGGYFCMYFHDCNLNVWSNLIKIMQKNHFKYLTQIHINKTVTLKNIISPKKSLSGDAVLIFIKEQFEFDELTATESFDEIEANIVQHVKHIIQQKGPQSTPELYDDGLIEYLIYNGWLDKISQKYKTLVDIFEKYLIWNNSTNKWECH